MANLITLGRLLLLFVLVAMAVAAPPLWQLADAPLLLLIIALDGVDGYVARRRGEVSTFGSIFDIVVDRVVENVCWIVLVYLGAVPLWVSILFITRGVIVDSIRYHAVAEGKDVYGMMLSRLGRVLVAGRAMRATYGAVKAAAFAWMFFLQPLRVLAPGAWQEWAGVLLTIGDVLVLAAVTLCVARAVPVIADCLIAEGIWPRSKTLRTGS